MFCLKCGKEINDSAAFCPFCGQTVEKQGNNVRPDSNVEPTLNPATNSSFGSKSETVNVSKDNKGDGFKLTVSLILAVVSLLVLFISPALGVITSIAGVICGGVGMKNPDKKKWSKIGMIASICLLVCCFFGAILGSSSSGSSTASDGARADISDPNPGSVQADNTSDEDTGSNQNANGDSLDELLGYIDEGTEILNDVDDKQEEIINQDDDDYVEHFKARADILSEANTKLLEIQEKAMAIKNLDSNISDARDCYFEMACISTGASSEMFTFVQDYLDYESQYVFKRPYPDDYNESKAAFEEIECPSYVEPEWNQYEDIFYINALVYNSLNKLDPYDPLSVRSGVYLYQRFDVASEAWYKDLLHCAGGQHRLSQRQKTYAVALAEEMHEYAALDPAERANYEFKNITTGKMSTTDDCFDVIDTIYPSLYNTYDAFLIIRTGCLAGTKKITVEAEIPGFTQPYKETIILDNSCKTIYIKPPILTGDIDLTHAKDAQMSMTIKRDDGSELLSKTYPIHIKSKNDVEWVSDDFGYSTRDNILCYLTPESEKITELKRSAIDILTDMTGGKMASLAGYQSTYGDAYMDTYLQVAALMNALSSSGVRYTNDVFSLDGSDNQHILFPDQVLTQQTGLCIETSLVMASALQSAGFNTFLVFPPGHAQVAVEVWEGSGKYYLIETTAIPNDLSTFTNYINDYVDSDYTAFPARDSIIRYMRTDEWDEYLSGKYVIDCNNSRELGLTAFYN